MNAASRCVVNTQQYNEVSDKYKILNAEVVQKSPEKKVNVYCARMEKCLIQ